MKTPTQLLEESRKKMETKLIQRRRSAKKSANKPCPNGKVRDGKTKRCKSPEALRISRGLCADPKKKKDAKGICRDTPASKMYKKKVKDKLIKEEVKELKNDMNFFFVEPNYNEYSDIRKKFGDMRKDGGNPDEWLEQMDEYIHKVGKIGRNSYKSDGDLTLLHKLIKEIWNKTKLSYLLEDSNNIKNGLKPYLSIIKPKLKLSNMLNMITIPTNKELLWQKLHKWKIIFSPYINIDKDVNTEIKKLYKMDNYDDL